jgi:hypothetical protein
MLGLEMSSEVVVEEADNSTIQNGSVENVHAGACLHAVTSFAEGTRFDLSRLWCCANPIYRGIAEGVPHWSNVSTEFSVVRI